MRKPLNALLHTWEANTRLGNDIRDAIIGFAEQAGNPAGHENANADGPIPPFSFAAAVYAHFLARRFGAAALDACGHIDAAISGGEEASEQRIYLRGAHLPIPPPGPTTAGQRP